MFKSSLQVRSWYPDHECRTRCRLRPPREGLVNTNCTNCRSCTMFVDVPNSNPDLFQPEHGWYNPKDVSLLGCPDDQHSHFYEYRTAICISIQTDRTNPKYFIEMKQLLTIEPTSEKCPICQMVLQERTK